MPRFRVILRARRAVLSDDGPLSIFEEIDLGRAYFPGRGLLYSIFIHVIVFVGLFFLSLFRNIPDPPLLIHHITFVRPHLPKVLAYLPMLEPGSQFMRFPVPKAKAIPRKPLKTTAYNTKGLSYPGPQLIISDVPKPTNQIQTVLQPDLEKPPILVPPLPLPNIVQLADITPAKVKLPEPVPEPPKEVRPDEQRPVKTPDVQPEAKAPEPAMVLPALELAPTTRMEAPKLILPPSIPPVLEAKPAERPVKMELPTQMKAAPPPQESSPPPEAKPSMPPQKKAESSTAEPAPETSEKPKEIPVTAPSSPPAGKKSLLSLTPMPASSKEPAKVPPGEARGRFVISPEPNLAASEKEPGSKTGIRSETVAVAKKKPVPSENEVAPKKAPAASKVGGTQAANDKGSSTGGGGADTARNSKPGPSSGSGSRSGPGPAQGSEKKAFAGITIVGGDFEPGDNPDYAPVTPARRPLQTSYGLNIISTEDSGGGLPYVGVFSNEQIYTVYLDMRQTEMEDDPSWTLEFAVIQGTAAQANDPGSRSRNQQGLILPFPAEKERPAFPGELVRKYLNKMIIVYGVINTNGKMEQISIKESPDAQLNEPVLRALNKWVFRPAQLNGEPVAARVLMGIPLWLPE